MKSFILVLFGLIAVILLLGGAAAYSFISELGVNMENIDSQGIEKIKDKVSDVASSESFSSSDGDIVSEEVKFNAQNGEGHYREVTYKDGGFRQYDAESGALIGSSYESDQKSLPNLE